MSDVKLFLQGREIFLKPETAVALTKQFADFNTFKEVKADLTNAFDIPVVAENIETLEALHVFTSLSDLPYVKIPAKLMIKGIEVVPNGRACIEVTNSIVKCTVYGGNISWTTLLQDKTLRDIDFKDIIQIWNGTNITTSWASRLPYLYPNVDYGDGTLTQEWQRPWIYAKEILERIFSAINYDISGKILTDPRYNGEIIECSRLDFADDNLLGVADVQEAAGYVDLIERDDFSPEYNSWLQFNNSVNDPYVGFTVPSLLEPYPAPPSTVGPKWFYNVKRDGRYHFHLRLDLEPLFVKMWNSSTNQFDFFTPPQEIDWVVRCISVGSPLEICFKGSPNGGVIIDTRQVTDVYFVLDLVAGQSVDFLVQPNKINSPPYSAQFQRAEWAIRLHNDSLFEVTQVESVVPTEFGDLISPGGMLPDMSQVDFVAAMAFRYGCAIIPDDANQTIYLRSWNEVLDNIPNAVNWDDKIDWTVKPDIKPRFGSWAQKNYLKYLEDSTVPLGYGDYVINVNDAWLQIDRDMITMPFAATPYNINGHPFIPRLESKGIGLGWEWKNDLQPRILMTPDVAPYNAAYFSLPLGAHNLDWQTLVDDYFQFLEGFTDKTKVVTLNAFLKASDVLFFDQFTPVYITKYAAYMFINKIIQWQGGKSGKVELIKIQ